MKKYKLIADYPNSPYTVNGIYPFEEGMQDYPHLWEEVKEPLFVTEDGVEIFDEKIPVFVVSKHSHKIICERMNNNERFHDLLYFYDQAKAIEWLKDNELIFSRKQILDALDKSYNYSPRLLIESIEIFKKELGL